MVEGAGSIKGQAGVEKRIYCCHFACRMKKMKNGGVKEIGEERHMFQAIMSKVKKGLYTTP
jgi:hypothetical protein